MKSGRATKERATGASDAPGAQSRRIQPVKVSLRRWEPKPFRLAQPAAERHHITFEGFALPDLPMAARRSGPILALVALAFPHFTLLARG
jgi:hypothetical protein